MQTANKNPTPWSIFADPDEFPSWDSFSGRFLEALQTLRATPSPTTAGPAASHPPAPPRPLPAGPVAYRSIDGSGNNLRQPGMNAAGADFGRIGPANFADGVDSLVAGLPNPRTISNVVVAGNADLPDPGGLSGMMYAWGQFIDHDLDLAMADGTTSIAIPVPPGDPDLDASVIPLTRVVIDPKTGHDGKPAAAVNFVTGWLDASMVYGSSAAVAAGLRAADGHMLTSSGGNLPIVGGMYAAGDVRAQENPDLTALQTLFVREHNYQVDLLKKQHPNWTGEQLYQQARAIVTAEIEHITYSEFLPHLLGKGTIRPYAGYNPNIDASISAEFAGAAYRFGHSIVSGNLEKIGEQGQELGEAESLKDAFFEAPALFAADGGADGLLRHLAGDVSNKLDVHIIDELRNFLDVPPDAMDLAAINIQRGRDLGLGSLNQTRVALHLKPYTDFAQITSDVTTVAALKQAYGTIDKVDLWTGGLAEDHVRGGMLGQTFATIVAQQFEKLRDGDRFWFENQGFDRATLDRIEHTSLSDLILRDTDTKYLQADAFVYYDRHSGTAGGLAAEDPDAPQLVIGSDGVDSLLGGPQDDLLVAGSGRQTLTGGKGADVFVIAKAGTQATITDFKVGVDTLDLSALAATSWHDLGFRNDHGDAVISDGGSQITLQGVSVASLHAGDVTLHR